VVKVSSCKIEGDGLAFVHSGGNQLKKESRRGFKGRYRLHHRFYKDVDYDIEFIGGIKTRFWWRRIILRYTAVLEPFMYNHYPSVDLADRIIASAPRAGGDSRGEGSLLGGLGNLLMAIIDFNNLQILTTCRFIFLDN
jgi:hypothetical protein